MSSAICFNLDQSKILLSGNGLNHSENVICKYSGYNTSRMLCARVKGTLLHYGSFPFTYVVGSESRHMVFSSHGYNSFLLKSGIRF